MATSNFTRMNYGMPLVCGPTYEQLAEMYNQDNELPPDYDYEWEQQCAFEDAETIAEDLNRTLRYHTVSVVGGHYYGFQFCVTETHGDSFDLDKKSPYCIDNDDAHYYFNDCRSRVLRNADSEKRRIRRWLHSLDGNGYNEIVCTNIFSNGEAQYAPANERTRMISAVRGYM